MEDKEFKSLKNELKFAVALITEGFKDLFEDKYVELEVADASEVGEMVEDIELKKFEKMWTREFVCPLCFDNKIDFDKQVTEGGGNIAAKIIAEDNTTDDEVMTSQTPRQKWAFEDEESFDRHMEEVHGIKIDRDKVPIEDKKILRDYGAHYQDFRHGQQVKGKKGNTFVVSSPEHCVKLDQQAMDELIDDSVVIDKGNSKYVKKKRQNVSEDDINEVLDDIE